MKTAFRTVATFYLLAAAGCVGHSPSAESPHWKAGLRRGRGVEPAELHRQFLLAHRLITTPDDPRNTAEDPTYLLAESQLYAGDHDFAAALKSEPSEVRGSVARCLVIPAMLPDFPRSHALLAPLQPAPNPALERTPSVGPGLQATRTSARKRHSALIR